MAANAGNAAKQPDVSIVPSSRGRPHTTASLPSGTVSFVFTDIEGSTERWERDAAAMTIALRRHDALMRTAIEANGGYVFKTIGDAFCAAFAQPAEAIAAARDAQRSLAAEDFSAVNDMRVRMALHMGTADERDGDYFGQTLNRVARLLAIGHGGQVLISGTIVDQLENEMPAEMALRDLGAHRLKDLARPERVYQLIAPGLLQTFPILRSLDQLPNNLPRQLTSFVGRDDEVAFIKSLIAESPLVTLVGTGGAGKTRCAVQIGGELLDGSGDGVWVVELASIGDELLVASAVAHALGVQEGASRPIIETLTGYLKRKRLLLILDNCEHVIAQARKVAAAILKSCPDVRILATSRERLNIAGERVYRMPSLSMPAVNANSNASSALRYGAPTLFVDRARAADERFVLTDENAPHVAEICRRLDGIPLALELAAARVKMLSPYQLEHKLSERFRLLTRGDPSALPRQQTMRALIDWSYDLLTERERSVFRKLALFHGSFSLETACPVATVRAERSTSDERNDEFAVLDLLSSLVDKSLVQAEPAALGTRYRLLESTRLYAAEKLMECGERAAVARAHAGAFLALAEKLDAAWETTPDRTWFAQIEPELDNFRAALEWSIEERGDVLVGQRLTGALSRAWRFFGGAKSLRWVHAAQNSVDATTPAPVAAYLDLLEAQMCSALHQNEAAYAAAKRALVRYQELNEPLRIAEVHTVIGRSLTLLGRVSEGEEALERGLAMARRLRVRKLTGQLLANLATTHYLHTKRYLREDIGGARMRFAEALAIAKETGHTRLEALVAGNLAEAEFRGGDADAAMRCAVEAAAADRASKDAPSLAHHLCNMAAYLTALGRYDEARAYAREALPLANDVKLETLIVVAIQHLAAIAALRPSDDAERVRADRARAARLLGYLEIAPADLAAARQYTEQQEYDRTLAALRAELGAEHLARLVNEGRGWDEDHTVTEALLV